MKRFVTGLLIILLASCTQFFDLGDEQIINHTNPNNDPTTFIIFNNPWYYTIDIYSTSARTNKILTIPRWGATNPVSWVSTERFDFYLTYNLPLSFLPPNFSEKSVSYTPSDIRAAVITVTIPRDTTTTVNIPDMEYFINDNETLFPDETFIVIRNSGASAFRLLRGGSAQIPDIAANNASNFVNSGQTALYSVKLTAQQTSIAASNYKINVNNNDIDLPMASLQAGWLYVIDFNGASASLKDGKLLTLGNL